MFPGSKPSRRKRSSSRAMGTLGCSPLPAQRQEGHVVLQPDGAAEPEDVGGEAVDQVPVWHAAVGQKVSLGTLLTVLLIPGVECLGGPIGIAEEAVAPAALRPPCPADNPPHRT